MPTRSKTEIVVSGTQISLWPNRSLMGPFFRNLMGLIVRIYKCIKNDQKLLKISI